MPGRASDPAAAIVPFSPDVQDPTVYPVRHGLRSPPFRVFVSWGLGNNLQVACLSGASMELAGNCEDGGDDSEMDIGGKVVEVSLGAGDGELGEAEMRKIAYCSASPFASLQGQKNSLMAVSRVRLPSFRTEWWRHVLVYSNEIKNILANKDTCPESVLEDPCMILQTLKKPTSLKAAWELMEMFYVDKHSSMWLPENIVDWLANYDCLLSRQDATIYAKILSFQEKIINLQVIEDDPEYWEGLSSALAVGWTDIVVKLLRLHGSYQLEQLSNRETENGLVEAVAVLISTMPRLRISLPSGSLGQCYEAKPNFMKAWEKWRGQISKLDCSAFWVQCSHRQTREGLRSLLQILLGNLNNLIASTFHWMELVVSHILYIRPFTASLESMHGLAQKCMQLKPTSNSGGLIRLLDGILNENIEIVLAECSKSFGPWMAAHAMDLLASAYDRAEDMLCEERFNLGGISIEELHRLVYAQVLSSHPLSWQIAPTYLASCARQGLGLLEILLYKQPVQHYQTALKALEICRLYELENVGSTIMKITGIYHWKHGRKGAGIFWLQQARDDVTLSRIAQQMFAFIGRSISDESFKQWEGVIELLGSEVATAGGLEFLHKYRDFKRFIKMAEDNRAVDIARQAMESLVQLMKSTTTPRRFWLPLLHDSVRLLNWGGQPLLKVSETNLLLSKLQELSMARLHPDFSDADIAPQEMSSVRLALATNLARAVLEEGG